MTRDLALLIDGDQVAPEVLPPLMDRLAKQARVTQRICVRNWRSSKDLKAWQAFAQDHGLELRQRDPVATGKNAADIELAIIAVDLLHTHRDLDFCIVSGDTDFTPVYERIKRAGRAIDVVTPKELQPAGRGRRTGRSRQTSSAAAKPAKSPAKTTARTAAKKPTARGTRAKADPTAKPDSTQRRFAKHVRKAIDQMKKAGNHERGWVSVNRLGSILAQDGHRREEFGFAKSRPMRQVLEDLGFDVMQIETGAYRVRI